MAALKLKKGLGRRDYFLMLVILLNLALCMLYTVNDALDPDETQHMHIAWNIRNGKIPYKDFFEHHGPLNSLLNGFLFKTLSLKPSFGVFYVFRFIAFFYLLGMLYLTFLIGRRLFDSLTVGLASAAFLSSLIFFQDKATEMRPDGLQNLLWLAGAYLVLSNLDSGKRFPFLAAGVLFGLSVLTNMKAVIGPSSVLLFLGLSCVFDVKARKVILGRMLLILAGMLAVYSLMALYFFFEGALKPFLFYNMEFNLRALPLQRVMYPEYSAFLLHNQSSFALMSLYGLSATALYLKKSGKTKPGKKEKTLFVFITLSASSTALLAPYSQNYLPFLPLLSVAAAYGLMRLINSLESTTISHKNVVSASIILITFGSLLYTSTKSAPLSPEKELPHQKDLLRFIVDNTPRDEPVLFTWNSCGGFVFNEDVQFYWTTVTGYKKIFEEEEGYDVFGQHLVDLLEEKRVRYGVSGIADFAWVSNVTYDYVKSNYHPEYYCLLARNNDAKD